MSTLSLPATSLPRLHIDTSCPWPGTARVALVGEVDLGTAPVLRDRLLSVLCDHRFVVVDVDLAGVSFLDCAGIGALVGARNTAVHVGRQLWVSHPQPFVHRVLELTGLLGLVTTPIDPSGDRFDRPVGEGPTLATTAPLGRRSH